MSANSKSGDLFIVDNSISGWTGLKYLAEWTEISKSFDIATGYFEIGALLELDGKWQKLEKIRILMGHETSASTKKELLDALRERTKSVLDKSLEDKKTPNPFLTGVEAVRDALKSGQIECRVYTKDKFHAKAYITHGKLDVVGSRALVGSSNFTGPGLQKNVELNVQIQTGSDVAQLQEWYETHWDMSDDVSELALQVIERQIREYTPFEVYAKSLQEFFKGHELTANEWDQTSSKMFPVLDRYQKEAYWALMKIARENTGAFLCDGVGLGKTFVGLMLIERLVMHEGKNVVLFAPKSAKEGVWVPHLKEWIPHVGGASGGSDFSNLAVFSHTDLTRKGDFPERFRRVAAQADAVIIDEAHHFRNPGPRPGRTPRGGLLEPGNPEREPSRYFKLFDLLEPAVRPKSLFLLTATPINNRLADFRHLCELFTRGQEDFFAGTAGVNNLTSHFNQMERKLQEALGGPQVSVSENMKTAREELSGDRIFEKLVVQRSRSYARESQIREKGTSAVFPKRNAPKVADYSIRKTYGKLLDLFEAAFRHTDPLFSLPMYYPLHWYKGPREDIDPFEENRQQQVVGLIRTNFLKRFESSVCAFESSCDRLLKKLMAFIEVHAETKDEKRRYEEWKQKHHELLGYTLQRNLDLWGEDQDSDDSDEDEDIVPEELKAQVTRLDRSEYKVEEMLAEAYRDLSQIVKFIDEARKFEPKHDDKLQKLIRLLKSKELSGEKVLIFSEFADTERYLVRRLRDAGIEGVEGVDSGTKGSRAEIIKRFAPYYNGSSSPELVEKGKKEIRVLIATDVLSEGLNLQDASRMMNYDIHWNPVRLMQRIGRVDRRMNPEVERRVAIDHPHLAGKRGEIDFWNFLPPKELNILLSLYTTVSRKTLLISEALGIEGKKLLTPEDDYKALQEFNTEYEGSRTAVEDMHLEFQDMLASDPALEEKLSGLPGSLFSGRKSPTKRKAVFFCYALPALDKLTGEFSEAAGTTRWYRLDIETGQIEEDPAKIVETIRSSKETPRACTMTHEDLVTHRKTVLKHIRDTYMKRVNATRGVKPVLKTWMELN